MKQLALLVTVLLAGTGSAHGQGAEDDVMQPIQSLFDAMRSGDSALARTVFHPQARLARVPSNDGALTVDDATLESFIAAIGREHDKVWDERIWDWEIKIDGNMATVWTKYAFYLGDEFSHCGVDAFQVVRTGGNWQILNLIDTMRKGAACETEGR